MKHSEVFSPHRARDKSQKSQFCLKKFSSYSILGNAIDAEMYAQDM
jgi:hypothetical protein